jgi:histidyl-tRNA synthetase
MSTAPRGAIERIRGMADVWPAERAFRQGIIAALERGFAAHGYRPLDTPVVEATELFLRKSGEERAATRDCTAICAICSPRSKVLG